MVSPFKQNNCKEKSNRIDRKDKQKLVYKPLNNKKYFLALKNYKGVQKIKEDILALGGLVEEFFSRELDYVVTNQDIKSHSSPNSENSNQSPATPQLPSSVLSNLYGSPLDCFSPKEEKKIPKTRSESLLERARQNKQGSTDVLENARLLKICVLPLSILVKSLTKLQQSPYYIDPAKKSKRSLYRSPTVASKARKLLAPYIKFEDFNRKFVPNYKEFKNLPVLDLQTNSGSPYAKLPLRPPCTATTNSSTVNDKVVSRSKQVESKRHIEKKSYCEVCLLHFTCVSHHLNSATHLKFVTNNNNYKDLDELISSLSLPPKDLFATDQ